MKKQGENCFIQWRIQGRDQGPDPPALDQTEVRRAEKTVFGDRPPLYLRVLDGRPLTPYLKVWKSLVVSPFYPGSTRKSVFFERLICLAPWLSKG